MILLYQFSILLMIILLYYNFALRYNIVDRPNERSSHSKKTIIGGGVIFPLAVILWVYFSGFPGYYYFITGLLLISLVSLLDDFYNIKQISRFTIHLIACFLLLQEFNLLSNSIIPLLIIIILIVGWLNAYNFMDGINGMTALYSIVIFTTFYLLSFQKEFIDIELIEVMIMSLLVFSIFNLRKKAIMFSGDVGSISLPYIITFIFFCFYNNNNNIHYILFFSVYGLDTVLTIFERIIKKENIFKSHRMHLYQYLANEKGYSHLFISSLYAIVQLLINIFVIYLIIPNTNSLFILFLILILLSTIYFIIKRSIVKSLLS